jgi:geranylgeranyl diphosphate synthase type I
MSAEPSASALLEAMRSEVEQDMRACLELIPARGRPVAEMIAYHLGWGEPSASGSGKRLRPLLCLASCAASGGTWQAALPAASAVELIHNFSLIHDDIEDRSETRRGRPTVWIRWGVAQALNTGDALLVLARLASLRLRGRGAADPVLVWVVDRLDRTCLELTVGQHLDLSFESARSISEEDYLAMIAGKTAALLEAAAEVGGRLAGAEGRRLAALAAFGRHLGLAFQLQDDVLGIWGIPHQTGKPAGQDLVARKKTYPVVYGLTRSAAFAGAWSSTADSGGDLPSLRRLLEAAGAREQAVEMSRHHIDLALANLKDAEPQGLAGEALASLARQLPGRTA